MRDQVQRYLRARTSPSDRLLVAVSGGPDSVALAHVIKSLSYPFVLGHVDHGMRKSSQQDMRFVKTLAHSWGVPCYIETVYVLPHARTRHLGLEEAARDLRYKALAKMAKKMGCFFVLTAHTRDDQAETILLNLLRGAGPAGLAGIPEQRELNSGIMVLRPLLEVSRPQILKYLKTWHLSSVHDPTNDQKRFKRNQIRHDLLPDLEKQYPGIRTRLVQLGQILREEEDFWKPIVHKKSAKTVRKNEQTITIDLTQLLQYHRALGRRVLRSVVGNLSFQDIERIFQLSTSPHSRSSLSSVGGWNIRRQGQTLSIRKTTLRHQSRVVPKEDEIE